MIKRKSEAPRPRLNLRNLMSLTPNLKRKMSLSHRVLRGAKKLRKRRRILINQRSLQRGKRGPEIQMIPRSLQRKSKRSGTQMRITKMPRNPVKNLMINLSEKEVKRRRRN